MKEHICDCGDYTKNKDGICDTCRFLEEAETILIEPKPLRNKIIWLHHIYNDAEYKDRLKKKKTLACIKGFTEQDIRSAIELLKLRIKNDRDLTMLTTNITESKEIENMMKHYANKIYDEFEKQINQVFDY